MAFLDDLCDPIGPWVFAGFGSDLQNKQLEVMNGIDDASRAVMEAMDVVEEAKSDWVQANDPEHAFEILIDIAIQPPEKVLQWHSSFQESWEYHLVDLLQQVVARDLRRLEKRLRSFLSKEKIKSLIEDVLLYLEEEGYGPEKPLK